MASISRPAFVPRSGGKIVRPRRPLVRKTPYDRPPTTPPPPPPLLPDSDQENPNWLSRLILSPTRLIASGAGKVLSSVFGADDRSSSSSSSDDEDEDSLLSEDDIDDEDDISPQGADRMEKTSKMIDSLRKEPQEVEWMTETKRVIAQLLMRETFSREECDKLIHIISSRVIDSTITSGTAEAGRLTLGIDVDKPDLRSTAVTEAKKWLEEKKLGSNSKSELEYGTCTLNAAMLPHDAEGEVGSPVDLAKSYMKARPPWASPSISQIDIKSPSPIGIQSHKEGPPYFFGGDSVSSSKLNRDSLATGSWNIMEEIRKVRSKATEEILRTPSSSRISWSAAASDYKRIPGSLAIDKAEAGTEDKMLNSTQLADAPSNLVCGVVANGSAVPQIAKGGLKNDAVPPNPATSIPQPTQDLGASPIIEGSQGMPSNGKRLQASGGAKAVSQSDVAAGPKDADGTSQALSFLLGETIRDAFPYSRSHEINGSPSKKVDGRDGAITANGFPSSGSSLSAGQEGEQKSRLYDEQNPVGSGHDRTSAPVNETCNLLSEASIEVPTIDENEIVTTGSQNSSSMQHEDLSQDLTRPKRKTAGITSVVAEKQQGRKLSRYNKRSRVRGK